MASADHPSSCDTEATIPQPIFENFDEESVYRESADLVGQAAARNFVVEFGNAHIQIARDLTPETLEVLLQPSETNQRHPDYPVRWINIWTPHEQDACVEKLGIYYGFSRRLRAIMTAHKGVSKTASSGSKTKPVINKKKADIEMGTLKSSSPPQNNTDQGFRVFLKNTMNYTSTDYGENFFCVGANWLHSRPRMSRQGTESKTPEKLVPPKHWSWIVLCNDGDDGDGNHYFTVITIHEGPWYEPVPDGVNSAQWEQEELQNMRANTMSVLKQLSIASQPEFNGVSAKIMELKTIRSPPNPSNSTESVPSTTATERKDGRPNIFRAELSSRRSTMAFGFDGQGFKEPDEVKLAGNLFYYLFEDYIVAAPILEKAKMLVHDLQEQVLQSGKYTTLQTSFKSEKIIPRLHELGKELRQVKHLFQSYRTIVERILNSRSPAAANMTNLGSMNAASDMPVWISHQARKRFERLDYHLQLLMLNNIEECLEESRALSETYFNLTAQKDSQATARLTRSATLLAKLSVFFLPIGFQTAFFSVEVQGMLSNYNSKHYWISFGVIASISFLSLFFFRQVLVLSNELLDNRLHGLANRTKTVVWDSWGRRRRQSDGHEDDDHHDGQ